MITDKEKCCGCGACQNICPNQCIKMIYDEEGFIYPSVDTKKCINCGLCKMVCPIDKDFGREQQSEFFAGYSKNDDILKDSSSGGMFWIILEKLVNDGAIVYGAVDSGNMNICHQRFDNFKDCELFRKSKYLQSYIGDNYRRAREDLLSGRKVLFSGTPCQIAGLYSFLNRDFDNLYTVEVVCHGTPSKAVFDKYIKEQEIKHGKKIISYCWRDKSQGWGPNRVSMTFSDGSIYSTTSQENPMQKGFLDNWYLRPSCYKCPFAKLTRTADITLADFWGYDLEMVDKNSNRGISLIVVSSDKGKSVWNAIKDNVEHHTVTKGYACEKSRHLWTYPMDNPLKHKFMKDFLNGKTFEYLDAKYINPKFHRKVINKIEKIINGL